MVRWSPVETMRSAWVKAWEAGRKQIKIVEGHQRWTFDDLAARAISVSYLIEDKCQGEPGHVALLSPSSAEAVAALFGIWLAGRTAVPLNPALKPDEWKRLIHHSQANLVLTTRDFLKLLPSTDEEGHPLPRVALEDFFGRAMTIDESLDLNPRAILESREEVDPDCAACVMYTSGTAGESKGVVLTHSNLLSNIASCHKRLGESQGAVYLSVLPLFHAFALTTTVLLPLLTGGMTVLIPRFLPSDVLSAIGSRGVNTLIMVPSMFALVLRALEEKRVDLSTLSICISGGGPLSRKLESHWEEVTGKRLLNGYGLTEASPVVSVNGPVHYRPGTVGIPLPDVRVEVWGDDDRPLPRGHIGNIVVRGPNVMRGYWRRPEESTATMAEGQWLRTGDLGILDEDGFLTLKGRKKYIIICSGENIYPYEVEWTLNGHPDVVEAVVVGRPEPLRGEIPVAYVIARKGAEIDRRILQDYCREHLAEYKIPREFIFVETLPRGELGKVLRKQLK